MYSPSLVLRRFKMNFFFFLDLENRAYMFTCLPGTVDHPWFAASEDLLYFLACSN